MDNKKLAYILAIFIAVIFLAVSGILFLVSRFYDDLLILDLISFVVANLTIILVFICFASIIVIMLINAFIAHRIRKQENLFFLDILYNLRQQTSTDQLVSVIANELKRVFSGEKCCFYFFDEAEKDFILSYPENNDDFSLNITDNICRIICEDTTKDIFSINAPGDFIELELNNIKYVIFPVQHSNHLFGLMIVSETGVSVKESLSVREFSLTSVSILGMSLLSSPDDITRNTAESLINTYSENDISPILEKEIERADRFQNNLGIVSVSVDPQMIDKYSISADSEVYSEILNILSHAARSFDYLFWIPSQERFLLVLPQSSSRQTQEMCERINEDISKKVFHIPLIDKKESLDLFWGITSYPDDTTLKANLLENSELSLKSAMENGKNIVMYKSIYDQGS